MTSAPGAPRPRVLLYGLTAEEIEIIGELAGSITVTDDLSRVHPEEHDALILVQSNFNDYAPAFPRRLAFGPRPEPPPVGRVVGVSSSGGHLGAQSVTRMETQHRPARDFVVTNEARELGLEGLVRRSCVPEGNATYTGFRTPVYPERHAIILAQEALKAPLALAAILEGSGARGRPADSVIWVPDSARSAMREWALFAFARWRETAPGQFPLSAEWRAAERWSSVPELAARRRLSDFDADETARRAAAEEERRHLSAELSATEASGASWRMLLTETGDALVSAVKEALETIGFSVQDSDELPQHKSAKREDLRVSDEGWTALVEVKGYGGAAKSNDLNQVTRASVAYAANEGQPPDALWFVPNIFRDDDPSQRGVALADRTEDLDSFGSAHHGCLIDTRELFILRQHVATGLMTPETARQQLKFAVGRYVAPSVT